MQTQTLAEAGFRGRGKTFHRRTSEIVQLINFQPSNYSDDVYINVGLWPLVLGEPVALKEQKFPIRGRIEDFIGDGVSADVQIDRLIELLSGPLSRLDGVKCLVNERKIKNLLISAEANAVIFE